MCLRTCTFACVLPGALAPDGSSPGSLAWYGVHALSMYRRTAVLYGNVVFSAVKTVEQPASALSSTMPLQARLELVQDAVEPGASPQHRTMTLHEHVCMHVVN